MGGLEKRRCAVVWVVVLVAGGLCATAEAETPWLLIEEAGWANNQHAFNVAVQRVGDLASLPAIGVDLVLALDGDMAAHMHPVLSEMEHTGAEWLAIWPTFAWADNPNPSQASVVSDGSVSGTRFTMVDAGGPGTLLSEYKVVARYVYEVDEWDGASKPWSVLVTGTLYDGSTLSTPQVLTTTGSVAVVGNSVMSPLSSPIVGLHVAIGGTDSSGVYEFGAVAAGTADERALALGNFRWEYGPLEITGIELVEGDVDAFRLESPVGTQMTIDMLDYVSGLSVTFNPDRTLAPGKYWTRLHVTMADFPPEYALQEIILKAEVVPEPATMWLLGVGLVMGRLIGRRRKGGPR